MSGWPHINTELPINASVNEKKTVDEYKDLRITLHNIEQLIDNKDWNEEESKRLDKSLVVLKLGAKMLKKILKDRGWKELKPQELREAA